MQNFPKINEAKAATIKVSTMYAAVIHPANIVIEVKSINVPAIPCINLLGAGAGGRFA